MHENSNDSLPLESADFGKKARRKCVITDKDTRFFYKNGEIFSEPQYS